MAIEIEVEVTGTGAFAGHKSNVASYSYSEESTPTSPADSTGGVGELSFDVREDAEQTILLYKDGIRLTDSFNGAVAGLVDSINVTDTVATVAGRSRLGLLNTTQTVTGGSMTLGAYITAVLAAGSITTGISIDAGIAATAIVAPNYTGDLWILLKDICTAYQIEVALVDDVVTVRPLRERTIQPLNLEMESWSVSDLELAQSIEVAYYSYEQVTDSLVYPKGGWNEDVQVYQVDAGQTLVVEIPVDFYLTSIEQPTVQSTVARDYTGPDSVYCVAGNDGLPVVTSQWTDAGGSLTVALKENGTVIEATIVGADIPNLAPFRIAVSSGPSDFYSTLRLIGTGVGFTRNIFTQQTGLTSAETATLVGVTIDNVMIDTEAQARTAAWNALADYALPRRSYSATARVVNRSGTQGPDVIYPSFDVWDDALAPGYDFGDFNTDNTGDTFQDFTDAQYSTVINDFENQAFGNVAGARVQYRDAWYRVRQADSTQDSVAFTSAFDTLFSDFNTSQTGDFSDFNAVFTDLTFTDFALIPLRT